MSDNVADQIANEFNPALSTPNGLPRNTKTENEPSFFKTKIAGLSFLVKSHKEDATLNNTVRFVPYMEKQFGDDVRVGYLKTDVSSVIEAAQADPNVEEIEKDEFEKATGKNARLAGY